MTGYAATCDLPTCSSRFRSSGFPSFLRWLLFQDCMLGFSSVRASTLLHSAEQMALHSACKKQQMHLHVRHGKSHSSQSIKSMYPQHALLVTCDLQSDSTMLFRVLHVAWHSTQTGAKFPNMMHTRHLKDYNQGVIKKADDRTRSSPLIVCHTMD